MNAVGRLLAAAKLCFLLVLSPKKVVDEAEKERARLQAERDVELVRRTLGASLLVVVVAAVLGGVLGLLAGALLGCAARWLVVGLQVTGAGILLWATLFVRGWDPNFTSWGGQTLLERVNQWIYRGLYFVGTVVFIFALFWPSCA